MRTLAGLDYAIIVAYLGISLFAGLLFTRNASRSMGDFFLSGRSLPWWLAGVSMAATNFSIAPPLAITRYVAQQGVAGVWFFWSNGISALLAAFLFAHLWRRAEVLADAELIELRYEGRPAAALRLFKGAYFGLFLNCLRTRLGAQGGHQSDDGRDRPAGPAHAGRLRDCGPHLRPQRWPQGRGLDRSLSILRGPLRFRDSGHLCGRRGGWTRRTAARSGESLRRSGAGSSQGAAAVRDRSHSARGGLGHDLDAGVGVPGVRRRAVVGPQIQRWRRQAHPTHPSARPGSSCCPSQPVPASLGS